MAVTLLLRRQGKALVPADGLAETEFDKVPHGKALKVVVSVPRSSLQNRLYWAVLAKVVENLEQELLPETLHEWMKMKLGIVTPIILRSGITEWVPGSTAFDKMPPEQFGRYLDRAASLLCEFIIPGMDKPALLKEAREMLGFTHGGAL